MDIALPYTKGVYRLPQEILLLIFSEFAWDGSEPFIPVGDDCPWFQFIRMRKTLLLVCRGWYNVVIPSLYSLVYLHRVGQLPALVRTLDERESANRGISHWVEHLRCEFYVPPEWGNVYRTSIERLVKLCGSVRTLVHRPILDELMIEKPSDMALLRICRSDNPFPGLVELTMGEEVFITASKFSIDIGLSHFQHLMKLHMEVGPSVYQDRFDIDVSLPNLTTLTCDFTSNKAYRGSCALALHWTLPQLQHLSMNLAWSWSGLSPKPTLIPLVSFCESFGSHLQSLRLDNRRTQMNFTMNLSRVFSLCRALTFIEYSFHLVPILDLPAGSVVGNTTLRSVAFLPEVVSTRVTGFSIGHHLAELTQRSVFPSLDTVILLDTHLCGKTVDTTTLSPAYTQTLFEWSDRLGALGIRFLNCESRPIQISRGTDSEYVNVDDSDTSDGDYASNTENCTDVSSESALSGSEEYPEDESMMLEPEARWRNASRVRGEGSSSGRAVRPPQLHFEEALETFERTLESCDEDFDSESEGS